MPPAAMKRFWNFLLIALCFLSPISASITLAQAKSAPPTVEKPAPPKTPQPSTKPTPEATSTEEGKPEEKNKEPEPTPEEIARKQKLIEADKLYLGGQSAAAQKLYREAKPPFKKATDLTERKEAITDAEKLSPAGQVYWREAKAGMEQKLETKIFVPLQFLVEQYPEFIPGQLLYAQALKDYNKPEEALKVLERATAVYPDQPDLLTAKINGFVDNKKWLEASLSARQFALLNPKHPAAPEFETLADKHLKRYQQHLRAQLRGNAIANVITGALGYVITGNLLGPISAAESTYLLLRGESAVGQSVTKQVKREIPLLEDEEVLKYVREVGNKLATVAGRNDFQYEFYVVKDDKLNAFALPGGKVFVNAGAIAKTNSEAELAGLLAHELSHAVLSHGFQLVTEGNLTASATQFLPYGGTLANLIVLNYSRDMERQADVLGTRILASSGYAADGLHNLMITLNKEDRDRPVFSWLSTHPVTDERISSLENLVSTNAYNRYAYEGVARHSEMQAKVKKLLADEKKKPRNRRRNRN
jgi:hypothetical protein